MDEIDITGGVVGNPHSEKTTQNISLINVEKHEVNRS